MSLHEKYPIPPDLTEKLDLYISDHFALRIAVPLIIQTFVIFFLCYGVCNALKIPFDVAAPAGMIGASNFFELAVAVAIALFGTASPAALATTVGVLTEVPVMLTLVRIANRAGAEPQGD
ncbi:arsenite transporter, ACR3 family [Eubacterium pyruvativorans]|uniref:Arsenite transporter, ACR3 family n=1 Tax=Eubacterium pyruvativorans TaxID=155865 RepID=A0A1I7HD44_9FIRM|nr:arsenite transporter, ACR3 family [Eubacterium pyruvativorans]SFU58640.1 arsenite transporter, ACR3 family [Eubacterium pyruvativorans]